MTITIPNLITYVLHTGQTLPPFNAIAYQYVIAQNGVFIRAQNHFVKAILPICAAQNGDIHGLHALTPSIDLLIPRAPESMLAAAVADSIRAGNIETLYFLHIHEQRFQLCKPEQNASTTRVTSKEESPPGTFAELHSHHDMHAFWSHTDDEDESGFRFFGVIGNLNTRPTIRLRLGIYGHMFPVPLRTLFSGNAGLVDGHNDAEG